jgi:hypothetical protein
MIVWTKFREKETQEGWRWPLPLLPLPPLPLTPTPLQILCSQSQAMGRDE